MTPWERSDSFLPFTMVELFPFRSELEETLEVIELADDTHVGRPRRLLRLALHHLLLGSLKSHLDDLRAMESAIDPDRDPIEPKRRLQLAVTRKLLYEDAEHPPGLSQHEVAAALERAAGDTYNEAVAAETGLALSLIERDATKASAWLRRRCCISPVLSSPRLTVETLYFARLSESDSCRFTPELSYQAAYAGVCAAIESGDFMAPALAAVGACAERSGTTLAHILDAGADLLDQDLFPQGVDEKCRLEVGEPSFCIARAGGASAIEVRVVVRGSGGVIRAAGPVVDGLVLAWPSHLFALLDRELAVSEIRRARRRSDVDAVPSDPAGRVDAIIELEDGLSLLDADRAGYSARVALAADWVRALRPDFRAACTLKVAARRTR